jgi:signal transduction histidine kinase
MKGKLEILNADKDRVFSIVAHDLKAPVFTLVGFSEILNDEFDSLELEEIKDFSARIYNQAGRLNDLITNLLEWGRIQLGRIEYEMKTFNPYLTAVKSIHLLMQNFTTKGIEVENLLDRNLIVRGDENMVRSVIMNLLTNAIKFSPRNSKIIISSKTDKDFAIITVQDYGVGISKSDLNKLFRIDVPHKSIGNGKEKGTGLGLIISKEFIEKNQGKIWVESESGKGTVFHFTLPLVISEAKKSQLESQKTTI